MKLWFPLVPSTSQTGSSPLHHLRITMGFSTHYHKFPPLPFSCQSNLSLPASLLSLQCEKCSEILFSSVLNAGSWVMVRMKLKSFTWKNHINIFRQDGRKVLSRSLPAIFPPSPLPRDCISSRMAWQLPLTANVGTFLTHFSRFVTGRIQSVSHKVSALLCLIYLIISPHWVSLPNPAGELKRLGGNALSVCSDSLRGTTTACHRTLWGLDELWRNSLLIMGAHSSTALRDTPLHSLSYWMACTRYTSFQRLWIYFYVPWWRGAFLLLDICDSVVNLHLLYLLRWVWD